MGRNREIVQVANTVCPGSKMWTTFVRTEQGSLMTHIMYTYGIIGLYLGKDEVLVRHNYWGNIVTNLEGNPEFYTSFVTHEMTHQCQAFQEGGRLGFLAKYLWEFAKIYLFKWKSHAYYDHPMERDARRIAGEPDPYPWKEKKKNRWWPWG